MRLPSPWRTMRNDFDLIEVGAGSHEARDNRILDVVFG